MATFDSAYYLANNPDVAAAGIDAETHYNTTGFLEGRDPNAYFDTSYYGSSTFQVELMSFPSGAAIR